MFRSIKITWFHDGMLLFIPAMLYVYIKILITSKLVNNPILTNASLSKIINKSMDKIITENKAGDFNKLSLYIIYYKIK